MNNTCIVGLPSFNSGLKLVLVRAPGGAAAADDKERHPPHPCKLLDRGPELAPGGATAADGRGGGAGGVNGVAQDLEEDGPGEEERHARGVPLRRGGDGVGHEREEEGGGGPDEEAECRVAGAAAVGAEHDEDGEEDNAHDGRHLHEEQIDEAGSHGYASGPPCSGSK